MRLIREGNDLFKTLDVSLNVPHAGFTRLSDCENDKVSHLRTIQYSAQYTPLSFYTKSK